MPNAVFKTQNQHEKQKTVKVTLWVKPAVKAELERLAGMDGLTLSKTGSAFLEEAIRQKLHIQHAVLLQPIIETTIRKQMRSISTRLAWLLARGAFESGQIKRLVVHVLKRYGVNQAMLKAILEDSSRGARTTPLRKTPQLETVLAEVEAWLEETDKVE